MAAIARVPARSHFFPYTVCNFVNTGIFRHVRTYMYVFKLKILYRLLNRNTLICMNYQSHLTAFVTSEGALLFVSALTLVSL